VDVVEPGREGRQVEGVAHPTRELHPV